MYVIQTSLGPIYPGIDGRSKEFVLLEYTSGFPSTSEGIDVWTSDWNTDTYRINHHRAYGDPEVRVYKNDLVLQAPYISNVTYSGIAIVAEMASDTQVKIFHVCLPGASLNYGYWADYIANNTIVTGATAYASVLIGTFTLTDIQEESREWDETPEADGETTDDNFGGEFADLDEYDRTQNQIIEDIMNDLGWGTQTGLDPYSTSGNSFFTPYVLSSAQFADLGYCLFSSSMWNTMLQWIQGSDNPLQGFLRCLDFPCALPIDGGGHTIAVFGQDIFYSSGSGGDQYATGHHLTSRYKDVNCGSIALKEVWGSARDYTDTNISLYLPFVGMRDLDSQLCVGRTLTLLLRIDCWTGDIVYILNVDNDSIGGKWFRSAGYVYRWSGNCASELPLGRIDNDKGLTTLLGGLASIGVGIATGNPLAIGGGSVAVGASIVSGGIKKTGQTSGNLTGNTGAIDIMYPYLVVQRAVPNYPNGWKNFIGAPKGQKYLGNDLTGYTLYESIHLEDLEGASEEEINELERVLTTEGIIF